VSAVSVSNIRRLYSGHRVAWVGCPATVARSLAMVGTLKVGWSRVSIESVKVKKVQCYRCWQFGHTRDNCKAAIDRSGCCFRCGEAGHRADKCESDPLCVLCKDKGMDCAHRLGSKLCRGVDPPFMPGRR